MGARDRPVFAVVGDLPHASGGLHQRLVAVEVVLGDEVITQSHRVTEVGDERVLVEEVCCVVIYIQRCLAMRAGVGRQRRSARQDSATLCRLSARQVCHRLHYVMVSFALMPNTIVASPLSAQLSQQSSDNLL